MEVLRVEKKNLEDDLATSRVHVAASCKETTDAKVSNGKLLEQNSRYRSIITKSGSDDMEVPDTKVHGHAIENSTATIIVGSKDKNGFRDDLKSLGSEAVQQFLMRGKIFEFVNDYLLSARSFGIGKLEDELNDFKKALDKSKKGKQ
ncbi:MAG: hypothetical protein Q9198_000289 [Flavoplaca austrocitrina]